MRHAALSHSTFFEHMEDFGYLRDIEGMLPEDFTAVFEIARVLEDPDSPLFGSIARVMTIVPNTVEETSQSGYQWEPNRQVSHSEEYEAALMRSFTDITRILPHQYLLPDEVFMERLARRSLWINLPVNPVIVPFKSSGTDFAPDNFKQKVYLLLDTSTSMTSHHRFQMAKAVVYVFLKRNLAELGHVYLRTFDVDLGPLQTATDDISLRRLIQYTMRLGKLGNGTVMERAILQAAEDIRGVSALSGAEILMVTDGACHLDMTKIREALGENIRINTVKIGSAEVYADDKLLADTAARGTSMEQTSLAKLEEELRRTKFDLDNSSIDAEKRNLRSHFRAVTERADELRSQIVNRLRKTYGREIEYLSNVYVNIDDISADSIFQLQQSEIDELRELLAEVEEDFDGGVDADTLREAALLYEHVQMLLRSGGDHEQMRQLKELERRLKEMLGGLLGESDQQAATPGVKNMARSDLHDLKMMLRIKGGGSGGSLLDMIVALVRKMWRLIAWKKT